jgi:hypothetical protein
MKNGTEGRRGSMKGKLALVAGLGIGYVLGARAGREQYERIRQGWSGFTEAEPVKRAIEPIRETLEPTKEAVEPVVEAVRTGTDDRPEPTQGLSADQVKERLHRTGSITDTHHAHPPEEMLKERM